MTEPRHSTSPPAIEAIGIHKSFRFGSGSGPSSGSLQAHVLRGVDLEVRQGECVFLVGPSGSGKSTLLAILGCILAPDAGVVRLSGENVEQLKPASRSRLRRERIGFVFQRFHLIRGLTALENVCVPLLLQSESEPLSKARGRELLAEVGLSERSNADPRRMSSGECQRVAIARALAADPELIFADEPTAALDEASGKQAMELLLRLVRERGKTAIVVTHDVRIFDFADRILQVQQGTLEAGRVRAVPSRVLQPCLESH